MASPLQAFNSLPPPAKFGIIGVGAAGAYVFIKKWRAAKAGNSTSPNMMTVGGGSGAIPGYDNGGGGGGIGSLMGQDSGLADQIASLQQQVSSLKMAKAPSALQAKLPVDQQAALYNTQLRGSTSLGPNQFLSSGTGTNLPGNESPVLEQNVTAPSGMVSTVSVPYNPAGSASQLSGFGSLSNPLWQADAAAYQRKYGSLPTPATPASAFLGL